MASLEVSIDNAVARIAPESLNAGELAVRGGKKAGKVTIKTLLTLVLWGAALMGTPYSLGISIGAGVVGQIIINQI